MAGVHGVTGLALGGAHTLAVRQTDDLLAWGANQNGVLGLGIGTSQDARTPMKVPKLACSQVCYIPLMCPWTYALHVLFLRECLKKVCKSHLNLTNLDMRK